METLSSMQGFQITDSINNYLPMLSASWQDQQTVYHMNALSKFVKKRQKKHLYKCLDISRCCITPETFITASSQPEVTPDLRPVTWHDKPLGLLALDYRSACRWRVARVLSIMPSQCQAGYITRFPIFTPLSQSVSLKQQHPVFSTLSR